MCGSVKVSDYQAIKQLMIKRGMPVNFARELETGEKLFPYFKPLVAGYINDDGRADSAMMNWGWRRDWDEKRRLFNSRRVSKKGQPIWHSPVWGDAIRERRCVIPINAFYEWDQNQPKGKRDRYRIVVQEAAYTLGGIYEISQDGEMFLSVCTTEPNEVMAKVHHRMPVIIDKNESEAWLKSKNIQDIEEIMQAKSDNYIVMTKENPINQQQIGQTKNLF